MVIAFVLALAAADADASVPAPISEVKTEAAKPTPFPLHAAVSVTNAVGSGTFNIAPFNPTIGTDLTLAPSAKVGDFNIGLRQGFGIEWTDSDSATYARQIAMGDTAINVSYGKLKLEDLGVTFNFGAGFDIPISMASRNRGKVTSLKGMAGATWSHDSGFTAGISMNAGYTLAFAALGQRFANQPARPYEDRTLGTTTPTGTCIVRDQSELDNFACSGLPSVLGFATTLNAGYSMLDGKLGFNGSLGYAAGSTMFARDDEFTAENASTLPVLRQSWAADLSASYNVTEWFVLTGGVNSGPPVLTALADNGVRTPFFDFFLPERYNNFSSIYVDTTFTF